MAGTGSSYESYIDRSTAGQRRISVSQRIIESWRDMGGALNQLLAENPSEARLLFYVMMSDVVFFLSWTLKTVVAPNHYVEVHVPHEIGLGLVVALLLRTSVMIMFAAFLGAVCKVFGGKGGWYETRAAVFWGSMVAAPADFAAALVSIGMGYMEVWVPVLGSPTIVLVPYYIGILPFLWFISAGLASVHGFARVSFLFMALSIGTLAGFVGWLYLRAIGMI